MFKVGDKVINDVFGEGEIVYGPYGEDCYFFKAADGLHHIVTEAWCKPVPKFEVGQVVRSRFLEGMFKVVAGPFNWRKAEETFYVLEDPGGEHTIENEEDITPVVE